MAYESVLYEFANRWLFLLIRKSLLFKKVTDLVSLVLVGTGC